MSVKVWGNNLTAAIITAAVCLGVIVSCWSISWSGAEDVREETKQLQLQQEFERDKWEFRRELLLDNFTKATVDFVVERK